MAMVGFLVLLIKLEILPVWIYLDTCNPFILVYRAIVIRVYQKC